MSWGYKVILIYAGFITMMVTMVTIASRQTNEMQDDNYYSRELHYQEIIDGKNNLSRLHENATADYKNDYVVVSLPLESVKNFKDGQVQFLRPSSKSKDIIVAIAPDKNGQQYISSKKFSNGYYSVRMEWESDKKYVAEIPLIITK
jgi:hypothetical protein